MVVSWWIVAFWRSVKEYRLGNEAGLGLGEWLYRFVRTSSG